MNITISNIGKISSANIEFRGITVIAGANDTGKSTIGKALFAITHGLYKIKDRALTEKTHRIINLLGTLLGSAGIKDNNITEHFHAIAIEDAVSEFINKHGPYSIEDYERMLSDMGVIISPFKSHISNMDISQKEVFATNFADVLNISIDEIILQIMEDVFATTFNEQITNIQLPHDSGFIELQTETDIAKIGVSGNAVINVSLPNNEHTITKAIYINDPYIMDKARLNAYIQTNTISQNPTHQAYLFYNLIISNTQSSVMDKILMERKLNAIFEKINQVCPGTIERKITSIQYKNKLLNSSLDINNVSTGIKAFSILKTLIQKGCLHDGGILILDEPEVHLHPEWQLIYAEVLVLMQKQLNLRILINTHSPYFLEAIEVYTQKHGIDDKCKFYMSSADGLGATIDDVTNNIQKIYKTLAKPFQTLMDARYSDD